MTAAIVLAGGRATRVDGVAKPLLEVGGASLLDHAVSAVADCDPIVIVGPPAPVEAAAAASAIVWTRESPLFGGPVAALVAGLRLVDSDDVDSDEVYVLAADVPRAADAVALLRAHPVLGGAGADADGICLTDADGRMQWLIGRYRTAALRAAAAALPDAGRDASIRSLLAGLTVTAIPGGEVATDVDTWDDLDRARAAILRNHENTTPPPRPEEITP